MGMRRILRQIAFVLLLFVRSSLQFRVELQLGYEHSVSEQKRVLDFSFQNAFRLTKQIELENLFNLQYIGTIYLGKDKQPFKVLFDTGSNWIWVPQHDCTNCVHANRRNCSFDNQFANSCRLIKSSSTEQIIYGTGSVAGTRSHTR